MRRVWDLPRPRAHRPQETPARSLRLTVIATAIFLAIVIAASAAGSEIDLGRFLPGAEQSTGRPRIVVLDDRIVNQGDDPALNLEITRPRYRLIGELPPGASEPIPAPDFALQYEWRDGVKLNRETRAFKTGPAPTTTTLATTSNRPITNAAPIENSPLPTGFTADYDPISRHLIVSAAKPIEVRVDGFLLRPISRTDKDGAQYRFTQANVLVLGQDLKRGETVAFEVVFTRPQDFYSIPIYVNEPGKPATYLTVSVTTGGLS